MTEILNELREIKKLLSLNQPILSFAQFCLFADLSEDYVRILNKDRKVPFYRPFGRKLYITREDAITTLKQNPIIVQSVIETQANHHLSTSKTFHNGHL